MKKKDSILYVRVPRGLKEALQRLADKEDKSVNALVNDCLKQEVKNNESMEKA